ncbi:DNA-directed DNA polymerase alpha catalytic subunit POL1 TDEL_0F01310 [Torulaspora delbrueckii]|uniref:DNA polymerase n=1 Tax=Torulaspora delbrueckii TaxID=4950 RepID=G8ZWE8_TORDE|nr:hypothetical protein TDEL_0F01310 [Torulaspora delbrueckii]CCE92942.1 hypothetical protein TDEL_0F01310 [Torulaspora delbrueckii]
MSGQNERLEKLKKLRAARNGIQLPNDEEDDRLYDEIDEHEYRSRKRQELLRDDFVVDDDGLGYVDRGVEEDQEDYSEEELDEQGEESAIEKKKSTKKQKDKNSIGNLLRVQQNKEILSGRAAQLKTKNVAIDEFDDILGEFDNDVVVKVKPNLRMKLPSSPTRPSNKPNPSSRIGHSASKRRIDNDSSYNNDIQLDSSPLKSRKVDDQDYMNELMKNLENSPMSKRSVSSLRVTQAEKIVEDDDSDDEIIFGRRTLRSVAATRQININSSSNAPSSPFVTAPSTPAISRKADLRKGLNSSPEPLTIGRARYEKDQVVDPSSGNFKMFWLDYCEVDNSLVLFGKIKTNDNKLVSGMVQIKGLCRELYFLPREGKTPQDVHEEIIPLLLGKYGIDTLRSKPERMKYCFELPEVPRESDYLKVLLPFDTPKSKYDTIPSDLSSDTFHHVFGGNANIFETFAIQKKIMGPCWLEFKNGDFNALQNASNCALEVVVNNPQDILPLDIKNVPGLDAISLAVQTVMNQKDNKQEIVSMTICTYKDISLDSPIPENLKPDSIVTLVRPPRGSSFPVGFAKLAREKLKGQVRCFNNEKLLLSCFCAMLKLSDPDVIIGHRLGSVYLDVLAHRLHDLNIPTFNALGRRARKQWPDRFGKNNSNMNHFYVQELMCGRLVCDIANEMGQSLTPKCQSWDLAEMYQITCGVDHKPVDINYQSAEYQEDGNCLAMALGENIENSIITAEVSFRIQLLSLTKQLTNLAGNAWSQTLGGTRAGRNEYILLHEFSRNGYIVPDKETNKTRAQRARKQEEALVDGEPPDAIPSSKKAKYQGGLVFEPEKGLHKNYVLVMDFNSLYPSIIQEFNICFTTVDRNLEDADELPNAPVDKKEQGVLPRLLANLVQRRREVKKIMASESDPHKRVQCDIRQQALKLTANSMYGCLGYVNSRFYAKPLAMLVTNKGREILMNTRQLAESMSLLVVYGDTDSVMIDSGCDSYTGALEIGNNFKKLVNERYRLLEIDIDNVFKKLLLHAKKKYAALNASLDKNGKEHTVLEVKGLDMKRREYCPLSKDVSVHVLNTILSDQDPETALQRTYEYLEGIRNQVEQNEIRMDRYKINTKLSKDPGAYPGGKNMPAVQVALRMRKNGRVVKAGTVITFVITKQEEKETGQKEAMLPIAERARALNEVMVKGNGLKPDPEYYLEKQIFGPVERLLERIESFDIVRLSEALGLDSRRYMNRGGSNETNGSGINGLQPLESTIPDTERFKDAANLKLNCPNCSATFDFGGIVASNYYSMSYNGLQCKKCEHLFAPLQINSQLERSIRSHISLYYAGWLQCDDPTCGNVTRQISVFGKRCLNDGCTGVMRYRYSDKKLYNQLLYFDSLFNCEKNKNCELKPLYHTGDRDFPQEKLNESSIKALTEQNRNLFESNRSVVQKYLSDCARRYVDMGSIFDFMQQR